MYIQNKFFCSLPFVGFGGFLIAFMCKLRERMDIFMIQRKKK